VIRVLDAETHSPLSGATVLASSDGSSPSEVAVCPFETSIDAGVSNCRAIPTAGKYHITVRADGYADAALDVEAEKDACGNLTTQNREVELQRLGSATQPLVTPSESCGG
jgi:hypothetical protein